MFTDYVDTINVLSFDGKGLPRATALNDASWTSGWTQAVVNRFIAHARGDADSGVVYLPRDDILRIRLSNKPVARDGSPEKNIHIACAADGSVVEVVLLQASSQRWLQPYMKRGPAQRKPDRPT